MRHIFIVILIVFLVQITNAGWTPAERISDENTVYHPRIAANGQYIHVTYSKSAGSDLAYYIRSEDNGLTWGEPYMLIDTSLYSNGLFPMVKTTGNTVYTLWRNSHREINRRSIVLRKSLNNGLSWGPILSVTPPFQEYFSKHTFCVYEGTLYVAYSYRDEDLIYEFVKSTNGGQTWSEPAELLRLYDADQMDMACRGDTIILVWAGNYSVDDSWESYYMKSIDAGDTWSDAILLSEPDTINSNHPSISINEQGNIIVCWYDGKYSPNPWNGDLFVRYSYDMGETWTEEEQISFDHWDRVPRIVWQGDSIHVVWQDDEGWGNIYYMLSPDNGLTWENQQRLDDDSYYSSYPDLALYGNSVHVVWSNYIDTGPGSGVYYSRWEPEVSAPEIIPRNYYTNLTAYPNPFNSTTKISYSKLKGGDIEIYDITGSLVKKLVLGGCQEGSITWDGTDLSGEKVCTGVYFAKAGTNNNYKSLKVVYLK